jgi:hypothetical protein
VYVAPTMSKLYVCPSLVELSKTHAQLSPMQASEMVASAVLLPM